MTEKKYEWKTALTEVRPGKILVRGYDLSDLMENKTFGECVYLLLKGELPSKEHAKITEAILIAGIDHGIAAPSIVAARYVASCGVPLQVSVAAGLTAFGGIHHGGAVEECAKFLFNIAKDITDNEDLDCTVEKAVVEYKNKKMRVPGFGHPYHPVDPRTEKLFAMAKDLGISGKYIQICRKTEEYLEKHMGRKLVPNGDAGVAAVLLDMGFEVGLIKAFTTIARCAGLIAHSFEEATKEKPFRGVSLDKIQYVGPEERDLERS